jgi:ring-1,2-phenylacetyl-CoA epoxidase subunit PaaC
MDISVILINQKNKQISSMGLIPNSQLLITYTLHLADNALILAQRNAEWCGHGPVLEQDIAISNISLDLLGQARNFYQYAAKLKADGSTEDSLASLRTEREFLNCLLVEQPNGDWAQTILRQFFFSVSQHILYRELQHSKDNQLAAIAEKSLKEVTYHLRWSSEWVIRLGDGTAESHRRMLKAFDELWMYTGEFFETTPFELAVIESGEGVNLAAFRQEWLQKIRDVFEEAGLTIPEKAFMQKGGKEGKHTEHLGYILTELQYLQRTYPGAQW